MNSHNILKTLKYTYICTWDSSWQNKLILIYCDKKAVVLSSFKTRDMALAAMAHIIFVELAKADINLKTIHVLGKKNIAAVFNIFKNFMKLCQIFIESAHPQGGFAH